MAKRKPVAEPAPVAPPAPPAPPPQPKAGQVWSAESKKGRRYIRIVEVRRPGSDSPYANVVEIRKDGTRITNGLSKGEPFRTALDSEGKMGTGYYFEPVLTETTVTPDAESDEVREKKTKGVLVAPDPGAKPITRPTFSVGKVV